MVYYWIIYCYSITRVIALTGIIEYLIATIGSGSPEGFITHDVWWVRCNHSTCHTTIIRVVRVICRMHVKHSPWIVVRLADFFSIHMMWYITLLRLSNCCNCNSWKQNDTKLCEFRKFILFSRHDKCPPIQCVYFLRFKSTLVK